MQIEDNLSIKIEMECFITLNKGNFYKLSRFQSRRTFSNQKKFWKLRQLCRVEVGNLQS